MTVDNNSAGTTILERFPDLGVAWVAPPWAGAQDVLAAFALNGFETFVDASNAALHHASGTFDLASLLPDLLSDLLAGHSRVAMAGTITEPVGGPTTIECASTPVTTSLAAMGDVTISAALRTTDIDGVDDRVELVAEVSFELPLTEGRTVEVVSRVTGDHTTLRLSGMVDGPPVSGLSALGALLGPAMAEVEADLHEPLNSLADLTLKSVGLELDHANEHLVSMVGITFEADRHWDVGSSDVPVPAAGHLEIELAVFDPFGDSPSLRAQVSADVADWEVVPGVLSLAELGTWLALDAARDGGRWTVSSFGGVAGVVSLDGGGTVSVHLPIPLTSDDWHFDLVSGASGLGRADVEQLLRAHLPGPLQVITDSIEIPHVGFVVSPKPLHLHTASAKLQLVHSLPLVGAPGDPKLVIEAVDVDLSVDQPTTKPLVTGSITGFMAVGPGYVRLAVHRYDAADQWTVSVGATQIDLGTIGDVVDHMGEIAGGPDWRNELPASLADRQFTLTDLSLDYVLDPSALHAVGLELGSPGTSTGTLLEQLDLRFSIHVDHDGDASSTKITGAVDVGEQEFTVVLERGGNDTIIAGSYVNADGAELDLAAIIAAVAPNADDGRVSLDVTIDDAFFAHGSGWELVGADLDGRIDLSNLPMIGKALPTAGSITLDLRAIAASSDLEVADVRRVNSLLPTAVRSLPDSPDADEGSVALHRGVALLASMRVGQAHVDLDLPLDDSGKVVDPSSATGPPAPASAVAVQQDSIHWIKVQRHFGPVHFRRIGAALQGSELTLAIDAAADIGGLTLSLDGLSMSTPVDGFDPTFSFRGVGIDYSNGDIEIGGALLRRGPDDYAGAATITTPQLTLSALGAYAKVGGHPSLFVSAVLDSPIGGPPFLYVTGLSAAFGYNRSLVMPPVEQVVDFPLVEQARRGAGADIDLDAELTSLANAIPVTIGESFVAIGLKFTSFKQIDSFALLAVQFGQRTEIDLLGVSHLVAPAPAPGVTTPPVADIEIGLRGRYVPGEVLSIEGRLTPSSYVLSKACRLTGGFAFFTWFTGDRAGDFVVSVGGYHPSFTPPDGYPTVPRVGFNWQVDPHVTIKGSGYYALVPHMAMAGGHLEATYHNGPLSAWFQITIDILIAWQPFHYEASASVHIGGSYTFTFFGTHTISVDVGAAVKIRGPEFSGHAEIDLTVKTISVDFGHAIAPTPTIGWAQFKASFLPPESDVCGVTLERGLVSEGSAPGDLGVINPSELRLATHSAVPCSAVRVNGRELGEFPGVEVTYPELGVGPCGVPRGSLVSTHVISLQRQSTEIAHPEEWFELSPITKNLPAALWGTPSNGRPRIESESPMLIENAIVGLSITTRPPDADVGLTWSGNLPELAEPHLQHPPPAVTRSIDFAPLSDDLVAQVPSVSTARTATLIALGLDPSFVRVGAVAASGIRTVGVA